jgi:hypothetical protein
VKSPKVEDLKFEPNQAFERLRKLARGVLAVSKKEIDEKETKKKTAREASPCGGALIITRGKYSALSSPAFALLRAGDAKSAASVTALSGAIFSSSTRSRD